jgi:hypothetical protein
MCGGDAHFGAQCPMGVACKDYCSHPIYADIWLVFSYEVDNGVQFGRGWVDVGHCGWQRGVVLLVVCIREWIIGQYFNGRS